MGWRDDVAAELPSPNEDEPASLRQNILDELSDHLASAAERERIHENDEETVQRTILNRFGDPAGIARRLWFDAMKGKLMLQKLTAAFAATAALAAIAICLVLWSAVNGATAAFETAVEQSRKDRERADKANAALLARLETMAADAKKESFSSLEWNPLKFKLLLGKAGERPAVGYTVNLQGQPYKGGEKESIGKQADKNGVVDFGRVRPGNYQVSVWTPRNARGRFVVHVAPGTEVQQTIRCPEQTIVDSGVDVEIAIELPPDLMKRQCRVVALIRAPRWGFGKRTWPRMYSNHERAYYELSTAEKPRVLHAWSPVVPFRDPKPATGFLGWMSPYDNSRHDPMSVSITGKYAWRNAQYHIELVALLLPNEQPSGTRNSPSGGTLPPFDAFHVIDAVTYGDLRYRNGLRGENPPTFTPQAGEKNIWRIALPPKLIANARERLNRYDDQKKVPKNPKPDGKKTDVTVKAKHRKPFSLSFNHASGS